MPVQKNSFLILLLLSLFLKLNAQKENWPSRKTIRNEWVFNSGSSHYLGDLGGDDQIGRQKSPLDLQTRKTRLTAGISYKRSFGLNRGIRVGIQFAQLAGDDKLTREYYRQNRNLNFITDLLEVSSIYEQGFHRIQNGQRYLSRVKGIPNRDYYTYAFVGVGITLFNPRSFYKGKWYSLQPLGTEGQGLNGRKKYNRFTVVIPLGMGVKTKIKKNHYLGFEFGYRITFTDYLDDASGTYFNNETILKERGAVAAHFADPSVKSNQNDATMDGEQRGDPRHRDGYFFLSITYSQLTYRKRKN
jgi:hypothetical protein